MNASCFFRLCAGFRVFLFLSLLSSPPLASLARADSAADRFWPQWRGPLATGVAPLADPPVTWSETTNVKWKMPIPGEGDSTPIVWDNRIFILSAIGTGKKAQTPAAPPAPDEIYQWVVLCLDRATRKMLWQKTAREEAPHEGRQENNTFASASPATDGKLLLAFISGSRAGCICYADFERQSEMGKRLSAK